MNDEDVKITQEQIKKHFGIWNTAKLTDIQFRNSLLEAIKLARQDEREKVLYNLEIMDKYKEVLGLCVAASAIQKWAEKNGYTKKIEEARKCK